jgi:hypothetical protein
VGRDETTSELLKRVLRRIEKSRDGLRRAAKS